MALKASNTHGSQAPRPTPYLWSERDISRLLKAAAELPSPFRAATYESFLGLLAVSGLRSGEARSLQAGDIDLDAGVITVSQAKFGRARLIPLHSSTTTKLRSYVCRRDGLHPIPRSKTFFVSEVGASLKSSTVNRTFRQLVTSLGLCGNDVHPRMHDLRHSFAVRTLINWHHAGHDIEARIPALVSCLGHVSPASTYWYLSASPELMEWAAADISAAAQTPFLTRPAPVPHRGGGPDLGDEDAGFQVEIDVFDDGFFDSEQSCP